MARKQQKPAGDHTGRKAEQLAKEQAKELERRQGEIALMNQQEAEESEEVHDPKTGQPLSVTRQPGQSGVTTSTDANGIMTVNDGTKTYTVKTNATEITGVGPESPTTVPGETVGAQRQRGIVDKTEQNDPEGDRGVLGVTEDGVRQMAVEVEESPTTVIRTNTTLEEVTIGHGNVYTFREGQKYSVPRHVADHLESKGVLYH